MTSRLVYIDALRGVAALYVVFGHALNWYFLNIGEVALPFEWLKQFTSALAGVFLFFAISGYVIPMSFEGVESFVVRRFFRLYPIFWVSVLPAVIHCLRRENPVYSWETIFCNLTMVPGLFGKGFTVGVYWTLAHELLFYALCIGLYWAGWLRDARKVALLVLGIGGSYWLFRWGEWMGFWPGATSFFGKTVSISLGIMFWGALWRYAQEGKWMGVWERMALWSVPLQCVCLVACRPFYSRIEAKANFPISFAVSIACAVTIFLLGTTVVKFKGKMWVWCGKVSYSIYLFHMFVVLYVARLLGHPPVSLFVAVVLVGSCGVAALGYYLVERPSMALGNRLTRGYEPV